MKRTNIMLNDEQHKKLNPHAKKEGRSLGELVRYALDTTYKKKDSLEKRKQVAINAYIEGFISLGKLSEVLGLDPISTRNYLREQGIRIHVQDLNEVSQDIANA